MSFNSCKNLGADMILGDVVAKTITCDSIIFQNADNTVETITATTGNFDVINATTGTIETLTSQTGNIETITSHTTDSSIITATDKFYVSNNAMLINNTLINTDTSLTDTPLLGNSGSATVGQYLNDIYPDSTHSYTLEQLAAGDDGSQSLIFTAGGGYQDPVRNTIQSYDSYRKTAQNLCLNPLGGDVIVGDTLTDDDVIVSVVRFSIFPLVAVIELTFKSVGIVGSSGFETFKVETLITSKFPVVAVNPSPTLTSPPRGFKYRLCAVFL